MATIVQAPRLPYGVGHFSARWLVLAAIHLGLIGLGSYAYSRQIMEGDIITGLRDVGTMGGAPWGLYVAFVVYFVGVSFAGIAIAALVRLLNLEHLRPISRMAELLTVVALILGAFSIIADLGQPLRGLVNLWRYARPMSPFFGTFTLVITGYLIASLVYLYLGARRDAYLMSQRPSRLQWFHRLWAAGYKDTPAQRQRHSRTSFWLAIAILPLLVTATSTLGFAFGIQVGRPGWYSALQAPGFVVLAGISGTGLLIVIAAFLKWFLGRGEDLGMKMFSWLSNFMLALTIVYVYFMLAELLTTSYAGPEAEARVSAALLKGEYAWLFWLAGGLLLVSLLMGAGQALTRRYSLPLIVLSGILVNVAAIFKRYLIVVPSLTHGSLLPYPPGSYSPTWVEYVVLLGLAAFGALMYIGFMKVFPIMEVPEAK